jgi:hypothetical protein
MIHITRILLDVLEFVHFIFKVQKKLICSDNFVNLGGKSNSREERSYTSISIYGKCGRSTYA